MASRSIIHLLVIAIFLAFSSCTPSKNIAYLQNIQDTSFKTSLGVVEAPIQSNDILSISISSLDAEASSVFNKSTAKSTTAAAGGGQSAAEYLVNTEGNIQIPILGVIKAAGLTKTELKQNITKTLLAKKLLVDPVVDIRYLNFEVTVLGEVGKPTVITVPSEKISLVKALGLAGDLTIYGKRTNLLLIREEEGKRITRHINLNATDFITSPYYYLQPNDVVYVEPNKAKIASAGRSQQLIPIVLTSLSLMVILLDRLIK
jgi:polysaccharide export outer membrane protein